MATPRFGGDEFVILVEDLTSFSYLETVVNKISAITREPITAEQHKLSVEMSIGVALYPDDASDAEGLLKLADSAMYQAKHNGKNCIAYSQKDTQ